MVISRTGERKISVEAGARILASELGSRDATSSPEIAAAAAHAWEKLANVFARIIGEVGIGLLLARSVIAMGGRFPWLQRARPRGAEPPWIALQAALEPRPASDAARAFADLLTSCIGLIGRFLGEPLVAQLLHEVWPEVFPQADKETT